MKESEKRILLRIKEWLFEYSAKFGFTKVLGEIATNHPDLWTLEECGINHSLPLLVILKNIIQTETIEDYPLALDLTEYLFYQYGSKVLLKTYISLQLSLKILVLFDLLKENKLDAIWRLDEYFPERGLEYPFVNSKTASTLKNSTQNFRQLFLVLISKPSYRKAFMESEYNKNYGRKFHDKIKHLTEAFVCSMHNSLPVTMMERILQKPLEKEFINGLTSNKSHLLTVLLENLKTFDVLDELKVLELLTLFQRLSEEYGLTFVVEDGCHEPCAATVDPYSIALSAMISESLEMTDSRSKFGNLCDDRGQKIEHNIPTARAGIVSGKRSLKRKRRSSEQSVLVDIQPTNKKIKPNVFVHSNGSSTHVIKNRKIENSLSIKLMADEKLLSDPRVVLHRIDLGKGSGSCFKVTKDNKMPTLCVDKLVESMSFEGVPSPPSSLGNNTYGSPICLPGQFIQRSHAGVNAALTIRDKNSSPTSKSPSSKIGHAKMPAGRRKHKNLKSNGGKISYKHFLRDDERREESTFVIVEALTGLNESGSKEANMWPTISKKSNKDNNRKQETQKNDVKCFVKGIQNVFRKKKSLGEDSTFAQKSQELSTGSVDLFESPQGDIDSDQVSLKHMEEAKEAMKDFTGPIPGQPVREEGHDPNQAAFYVVSSWMNQSIDTSGPSEMDKLAFDDEMEFDEALTDYLVGICHSNKIVQENQEHIDTIMKVESGLSQNITSVVMNETGAMEDKESSGIVQELQTNIAFVNDMPVGTPNDSLSSLNTASEPKDCRQVIDNPCFTSTREEHNPYSDETENDLTVTNFEDTNEFNKMKVTSIGNDGPHDLIDGDMSLKTSSEENDNFVSCTSSSVERTETETTCSIDQLNNGDKISIGSQNHYYTPLSSPNEHPGCSVRSIDDAIMQEANNKSQDEVVLTSTEDMMERGPKSGVRADGVHNHSEPLWKAATINSLEDKVDGGVAYILSSTRAMVAAEIDVVISQNEYFTPPSNLDHSIGNVTPKEMSNVLEIPEELMKVFGDAMTDDESSSEEIEPKCDVNSHAVACEGNLSQNMGKDTKITGNEVDVPREHGGSHYQELNRPKLR